MPTDTPRVTLLIGGSGGIGRAVARRCLDRGDTVVITGRDESRLAEATASLGCDGFTLDATDFAAAEAAVARVIEQHGRLDAAANLAGSILIKPAHLTSADEFAHTLAQNSTTAFSVLRACARPMQKQGGGSIVLMSSCAARLGLPSHEAIACAKAAVQGLTISAASTYAANNIRVNCVAPGLTDTPMASKITSSEPALKASTDMHPLGRIASPDDVAAAVAWLLGPDTPFVTGQIVGVDGGLATARSRK